MFESLRRLAIKNPCTSLFNDGVPVHAVKVRVDVALAHQTDDLLKYLFAFRPNEVHGVITGAFVGIENIPDRGLKTRQLPREFWVSFCGLGKVRQLLSQKIVERVLDPKMLLDPPRCLARRLTIFQISWLFKQPRPLAERREPRARRQAIVRSPCGQYPRASRFASWLV